MLSQAALRRAAVGVPWSMPGCGGGESGPGPERSRYVCLITLAAPPDPVSVNVLWYVHVDNPGVEALLPQRLPDQTCRIPCEPLVEDSRLAVLGISSRLCQRSALSGGLRYPTGRPDDRISCRNPGTNCCHTPHAHCPSSRDALTASWHDARTAS